MGNPPVDGDDYDAAAAAFRKAWERLLAAVRATRQPRQHFDRATETGKLIGRYAVENAEERATAAVRIQDDEDLTLEKLGEQYSMSKQRMGRLTKKARRQERSPQ